MADVVDRATRSRMMSNIRSKNTQPELYIRSGIHQRGFRYRLHATNIPGKPDIVLPKYKALIIVQGCFWHGHNCHYFKWPKSNKEFWKKKIALNKKRDSQNSEDQKALGWRILVVWECAIRHSLRDSDFDAISLVAKWLNNKMPMAELDEQGLRKT